MHMYSYMHRYGSIITECHIYQNGPFLTHSRMLLVWTHNWWTHSSTNPSDYPQLHLCKRCVCVSCRTKSDVSGWIYNAWIALKYSTRLSDRDIFRYQFIDESSLNYYFKIGYLLADFHNFKLRAQISDLITFILMKCWQVTNYALETMIERISFLLWLIIKYYS